MSRAIPRSQKAAIYTGVGQLQVREVPVQAPSGECCLIRVERCGICGSDLHNFRGQSLRNTFQEWMQLGFADGHEYTGTVVAVGPEVRELELGVRVAVECTRHCGTCASCRAGRYNTCIQRRDLVWRGHGGFAQYALAPEHAIYPVPDVVSNVQAALIEPTACALRAVRRGRVTLGDAVVVVGGGTIGQLSAGLARTAGAAAVYLIIRYKSQAERAYRFGVTDTYPPDQAPRELADVAIDSVCTPDAFKTTLDSVKRNGRVVLVGSPTGPGTLHLGPIVGKELSLSGSLTYARDGGQSDFQHAIDLIANGGFDPSPVVTHEFPLSEIDTAFATALDKSLGSVKVHLRVNE
jgi:2-desacetyl-2-hydroxyethyl bacteriochlorophyllide A dehydrogenase